MGQTMKSKAKSQDNTPIKQFPDSSDPYFILECLSKTVDEIEMSVRTANGLMHANIRTIAQLVQKTEEELLAVKAFGRKSVFELKEILAEMGLSLGMDLRTMQFNSEKDSEKSEFVAIGLLGNRLKLFSLHRDGRFVFLDKMSTYGGVYVITSETLRLKQAVEELETLINEKNVREEDLQEFFEKNQEFILNDQYKKAHSKVVLQKDKQGTLVPDFILEPYNPERLCDILDLKLPSAKVWILKKNRPRFSYAVLEAVAQLREYSQFFEEEDNRSKILQEYGLLAYKPKLFVIIGRRGPVTPLVRRRIEIGTPDTKVLTYDDIIEKIRQTIFSTRKGKREISS
jgi:hypothetical protein